MNSFKKENINFKMKMVLDEKFVKFLQIVILYAYVMKYFMRSLMILYKIFSLKEQVVDKIKVWTHMITRKLGLIG